MHAMHAAQAAMAVLASEDMRATAMGRLSLSYGVGMVLGSYAGGAISAATSNQTSAIVAALLSFSVLPINWFTLRSDAPSSKSNQAIEKAPSSIDLYKICPSTVGFGVVSASQYVFRGPAPRPKDIGLVMSVGGVVSIVANGVLLQFFLSRWSERSVIFGSSVVIALSFVLYAHLPIGEGALAVLMALTVPLMGASAIANTVLSSQMSKGAKNEDRATAIGLSHASRSACGLVAPTLGAIVLQDYGFQALGYTCAIATVISIACSTKPRPSA
ncbi:hypothetical protein AeRB84_003893 [Aphanomyces euteiches]|nr:hypothetical protein AeRB84_003893 [Aphanomyces euteiches]